MGRLNCETEPFHPQLRLKLHNARLELLFLIVASLQQSQSADKNIHRVRRSKTLCTFFPIPLVGDGAGDTGTKSMRFGEEEADFSRSLSL